MKVAKLQVASCKYKATCYFATLPLAPCHLPLPGPSSNALPPDEVVDEVVDGVVDGLLDEVARRLR